MWRLNSRAGTALLAALTIAALALIGRSAPSVSAHHLCPNTGSPNGPFDIQTYEAADYRNLYAETLDLAGANRLFPDIASFALPRMDTGDRAAGSTQTVDPNIPPVLLKAIAYLESGWAQASFSPLVDYGETGPVLASHDCGYGIMQVTTGMQNISGVPSLDQAMIGSHYAFNIARGARILADKWNMAPELRPVIGMRDPTVIENWYYSIWGYNGWAFQNHPLNPSFSTTRAPYSCGPASDGLGHDRSQYPYQEVVLGCVTHPPSRLGTPLWPAQDVHLPELTDAKFAGPMSVDNWNPCTYSAQCTAMDIPTPNTNHRDLTAITLTREDVIGRPAMAVSPTSVQMIVQPLTTSLGASFSVSNTASGVLGYRVTSNATWLKVSPAAGVALGSDLGAKSGSVSLTVNPGSLGSGQYNAQVKVESLYATGGPQTVIVDVTVRPPFAGERAIGDFNGDGADDVIYLCCGDTSTLWSGQPDGSFAVSQFSPSPGYVLASGTWTTGDFNGDGKDDLLHAVAGTSLVWTSRGDGSFTVSDFRPNGYVETNGSWIAGDFDGNGRGDVLHINGGSADVWLANGDATFTIKPFESWPGYGFGGEFVTGDYNGDGRTDMLHLCCGDYANVWYARADGLFEVAFVQAWPGYNMLTGQWLAADVNGDSRDDLFHACCSDYAHVWLAGASGFAVQWFQPWPLYGMQTGFWETGDFNNDSRDDLMHACCYDYVHTWMGTRFGTFVMGYFQPWPAYGIGSGFWSKGDFNGDHRADMLHLCCNYANLWAGQSGGFAVRPFQP